MENPSEHWVRIAGLHEFDASRKLVRELAGQSILLIRTGNEVVAVRNRCSHLGEPLEAGRVMAGQIQCPFHGACFDLRTGAAVSGPAVAPLQRYPVRVQGADVLVDLRAC